MRRGLRRASLVVLGVVTFGVIIALGAGAAGAKGPKDQRPADRVVMFASDGMRPDLMEKYAKAGSMPTYKKLMKDGATGDNGMLQAFPPNTGVGWFTMATGTYPSEHGSTNNTFHRGGDSFANSTSFSGAGILQADTIGAAAERAGKKVASIDWVGGASSGLNGPTVDFATFYNNRGVLVGAADPVEQAGAAAFGTVYNVGTIATASGWAGVPPGDPAATPKETTWSITVERRAGAQPEPDLQRVLLRQRHGRRRTTTTRSSARSGRPALHRRSTSRSATSTRSSSPAQTASSGPRRPDRRPLREADLPAGDLSQFRLYATSLARATATCHTAACDALPAGGAARTSWRSTSPTTCCHGRPATSPREEGGLVDEDTYVEQGRDLERAYSLQVINFVLGTLQPDTELAMVGYPFTDEVSHQFMGLVSPTEPGGVANPCYDVNPKFDDVTCTGRKTAGRVAIREGYIRSAYEDADEKLAIARELMGGDPTTFAGSDHGFAPQSLGRKRAQGAARQDDHVDRARRASVDGEPGGDPGSRPSRCMRAASTHGELPRPTRHGGGERRLRLRRPGEGLLGRRHDPGLRQPDAAVRRLTNAAVRAAVEGRVQRAQPPGRQAGQPQRIMDKEELRNVDGSDSLHPNRSGDVVVVLQASVPVGRGDGEPGDLPVPLLRSTRLPAELRRPCEQHQHARGLRHGRAPLIKKKKNVKDLRAIDVAPTIAFLMDIPARRTRAGGSSTTSSRVRTSSPR